MQRFKIRHNYADGQATFNTATGYLFLVECRSGSYFGGKSIKLCRFANH